MFAILFYFFDRKRGVFYYIFVQTKSYILADARWRMASGTSVSHSLPSKHIGCRWAKSWATRLPSLLTKDQEKNSNCWTNERMEVTKRPRELSWQDLDWSWRISDKLSPSIETRRNPASYTQGSPKRQERASSISALARFGPCLAPASKISPSWFRSANPHPSRNPQGGPHQNWV